MPAMSSGVSLRNGMMTSGDVGADSFGRATDTSANGSMTESLAAQMFNCPLFDGGKFGAASWVLIFSVFFPRT